MFCVFMPQQGGDGRDTDTLERSGCSFFMQLRPAPVCHGPQTPPVRGESRFPDLGESWCFAWGGQHDGCCCSGSWCEIHLKNTLWGPGESGGNPGGQLREGRTPPEELGKAPQGLGIPAEWVSGSSPKTGTGKPCRVFKQMREDGGGISGREPGYLSKGMDAGPVAEVPENSGEGWNQEHPRAQPGHLPSTWETRPRLKSLICVFLRNCHIQVTSDNP